MVTEYVVWGLRPGEIRKYMEEIIGEKLSIEKARTIVWAAQSAGWTCVRVSKVDLRQPPDFTGTLNRGS
jgi:hypothetical protein